MFKAPWVRYRPSIMINGVKILLSSKRSSIAFVGDSQHGEGPLLSLVFRKLSPGK